MKWLLIVLVVLVVLAVGYMFYGHQVVNPRVVEDLRSNPGGARAERVMVLNFPDGSASPVNYLREGDKVYAGSDGRWWRAFKDGGAPVTMFIKGQTLSGYATVELDDRAYIDDIFSRLRPAASWVPDALDAKLVVITLDEGQ